MVLSIYMKSGNRIRLRWVKEYEFTTRGNEVTGIRIERTKFAILAGLGGRLLVKTIDLSQIEAVTVD